MAYKPTIDQKEKTVIENLWLNYFNDTLYEKGIITERKRNQMRTKINQRSSSIGQ